jgi:pimeloyl-ACP methyl ester carboxylesterase
VLAPLAKFIDWSVIQVTSMKRPPLNRQNPRLEEALQFLKEPNFIPAESQPAQVEFNPNHLGLHFSFPTPRPSDFARNNIVYGRLYRCRERWQKRPVILLLHGWRSVLSHRFRFPWIARRCNEAGFNAATLEAPYNSQRRPCQPGGLDGPDYLRLAEGTAQAIAEIRALTGWLLGQGCPSVALWGGSYGGWLAGLTVSRDERFAALVMTVPGVRSNSSRAELIIRRSVREALQGQRTAWGALDMTALNLTSTQPAIPKENILLVEAVHDLFATKESIEELWQKWGEPDIWRLPHGHFSFSLIGAPGLLAGRVIRWLTPRLKTPVVAAVDCVTR